MIQSRWVSDMQIRLEEEGDYLEVENLGIQYYIGKQEIADKLILSIKEI